MTLAAASRIVDHALQVARRESFLPLAVVVLDAGGQLVACKREDGAGLLRVDIALGKARGALGMGIPSRLIHDRLASRPAFLSALAACAEGRFIPVPGGVLVLDRAGGAIGAVGVSGDTSDKDEYCAIEGIKAAGLASDPAEPSPDWRAS